MVENEQSPIDGMTWLEYLVFAQECAQEALDLGMTEFTATNSNPATHLLKRGKDADEFPA